MKGKGMHVDLKLHFCRSPLRKGKCILWLSCV